MQVKRPIIGLKTVFTISLKRCKDTEKRNLGKNE